MGAVLTILFFAALKDLVGSREMKIPLDEPTPVRIILKQLEETYPELSKYETALLIAVNQEYSNLDSKVSPGDELAFFPPVSGGGI